MNPSTVTLIVFGIILVLGCMLVNMREMSILYAYNLMEKRLEKRMRTDGYSRYVPCSSELNDQFLEHVNGNPDYLNAKSYHEEKDSGEDVYRVYVKSSDAKWLIQQERLNRALKQAKLEGQFKTLIEN